MIAEQIPEVQRLSPEQKLALAAELFEDVADCGIEAPDPEVVRLLDERMAAFEKNSDAAAPWSEVKKRILASRGRIDEGG